MVRSARLIICSLSCVLQSFPEFELKVCRDVGRHVPWHTIFIFKVLAIPWLGRKNWGFVSSFLWQRKQMLSIYVLSFVFFLTGMIVVSGRVAVRIYHYTEF